MHIREATVEDAESIARVHVETWREAYRGIVADDVLDGLSIKDRGDVWRSWFRGEGPELGHVLVATVDDRIVGFVNAGPTLDEDASPNTGEIRAIYVSPEAWGTGAGAALMAAALERLRRTYARATLWVLEANERGRRFYERGGWAADGASQVLDRLGGLRELRYRIDL